MLCVCVCDRALFFLRISRNLSSAMLTLAGRQTWGLAKGTYHNRTWKNGADSLFAVQGEVVYHFGKMFGCLPCTSSFGPLSWFSCTSTFPFKSMSGFFTHTNEVNGWLLFSSQFQTPSPPPKCSHDLYKSCCGNLPSAFNQISDSTEWSIRAAIFICHRSEHMHAHRRTATQQQRGRDAILIKTMSFSKAIYTTMKSPAQILVPPWRNVCRVCVNHAFTAHSANNLYLPRSNHSIEMKQTASWTTTRLRATPES